MESYGLFFRLDENGETYRVAHGGSVGVFFSYFCFYPQHRTFLYFVGNNDEAPVVAQLKDVLKMVEHALSVGPQ